MNKAERYQREQSLLAVALDCYSSNQWESVTIASIAKRAGVAKGTVYLHFTSKDEIFALLALQFYQGLLQECSVKTAHNGRTQLKTLIKSIFTYYHNEQKYRHIVQYCRRDYFKQNIDPELAASLDQSEASLRNMFADCLHKGNADGSLQGKVQHSAEAIHYTLNGALHQFWCNTNNQFEIQLEFIHKITNYILLSDGEKSATTSTESHSPLELVLESS